MRTLSAPSFLVLVAAVALLILTPMHAGAQLGSLEDLGGLPCTPSGGDLGSGTSYLLYLKGHVSPTLACAVGQSATGRFLDFGIAVVDTQSRLMWEKKVPGSADPHGADEQVTSWCEATGNSVGFCAGNTASWIGRVNGQAFAGHTDWRVPTLAELQGIVDPATPGCDSGLSPCIDPVFGPTASSVYWSATESDPAGAWGVNFFNGNAFAYLKSNSVFGVRAVRGGP